MSAEHERSRFRWVGVVALVAGIVATAAIGFQTFSARASISAGAAVDPPVSAPERSSSTTSTSTSTTIAPAPTIPPDEVLPPSGWGRRVVFSVSGQRVWWVDEHESVVRTSLVSGRENTPELGVFRVFSKSENATGLDGSRMDWFVRFTRGPNGWAIGFHDIPRVNGELVQTEQQLGQPLSHGCIRQRLDDALFTWDFLDIGSYVVVVA